mgnify:CR=1 FL=1
MKIVIIGGVAAGTKAAAKSKRLLPDSEVDIYTMDTNISYSTCGLPYYIEGTFEDWRSLIVRPVSEFEKAGINVHTEHKAIKLEPDNKKVIVKNLKTNEILKIDYDKLVIATGATPVTKGFENVLNKKNFYTLRTLEDGIAIREKMKNSKNITLVGGGYINIEVMEAFVKNDKNVTMIEQKPFIMPILDEEISALVQNYVQEYSNNKVKIINEDRILEFIGDDEIEGILTEKGIGFETDMVVLSIGVKPVVELAKDAGIEIGTTGAIKVNSRMETNIPDIYACGDCAEKVHIISGTSVWIPLGATANKEGRTAAMNLCGQSKDFEGVLGSYVTRYLGLNISKTGFTEREAKALGYDTVSTIVTKKDKAGYMPDSKNVTLKLVADMRSHEILGAQAIGCGDADAKIDSISVGLANHLEVKDLLDIDLTYSPPFSASVDILHSAARIIQSKLRN